MHTRHRIIQKKLVSVIIPCFNCEKHIITCIDSIKKSSYPYYEIIVIDDCSNDGTFELLKDRSDIKLIKQKSNSGPAIARNIGVKKASGNYLVFLDADTTIEKNCLEKIVEELKNDLSLGAIQTLIMKGSSQEVDSAGHFLSFFGFPYETNKQIIKKQEIFGAKSAGMAIKKDVFLKVGGFDEDYFIYGEETDLCWRVWNAGFNIKLIPEAPVFHFEKSSLNKNTYYKIFYEGAKNNTANIIKNSSLAILLWLLPIHVSTWILIAFYVVIKRRVNDAIWVFKGLLWNIRNLKKTINKRDNLFKTSVGVKQCQKIMFGKKNILDLLKQGVQWVKNV